ncbi:MAG TPA: pyridoxamine 5'-phosphate oxidase family protein [Acidimicrobiales bacterium]|nr:pyridoxamine 5'-phosphate oxidase family protein [Acidimicrobiales bacterium]
MDELLKELTREECVQLLKTCRVGRVAVVNGLEPLVVPVNYAMAGDHIVFRTGDGTKLRSLQERPIAFQVDEIDLDVPSGWSVFVVGVAQEIAPEFAPEVMRRIGGPMPEPAVGGPRNHWIELRPRRITGRRLLAAHGDSLGSESLKASRRS